MNLQVTKIMLLNQQQEQEKQEQKNNKICVHCGNPITNKILVKCFHCGIEFLVWKCRINRANKVANGHLFCSIKCSRDSQPKRKDKFVWCTNCKWIEKTKLILIPKGHNGIRKYKFKKDQYMCPICKDNISCKKKN